MLTKQHIAAELTRMSKVQISDITRAIKDSQKVIALNEVTDLGLRLNLLADAIVTKPAAAAMAMPDRERMLEPTQGAN
ncbi:MAG: hypothetical protein K2Y56_19875 [Methylobacterium sp.]|uniref:hypothetical protein n=1 Tax=Methylobacterium sp. TaxID=409 RepID=UPI0025E5124A|nr:hypothetical protein [Methylobacterium sp.]MBX9933748.1 hypothetical protein [Methylobacterium sp.]